MIGVVVRSRTVSTALTMASAACAGQSPPISEDAAPTEGIERGGVDAVDSVLPVFDASEPVSIDAILPTKLRG
jgi:hypothetical protein